MAGPRGRRMLLTANGICNDTLLHTLTSLVDRPLAESRLMVVLTATLGSDGDKRWLIDSLAHLAGLGWTSIDLVDVAAPTPDLSDRFEAADVVYVQGGNQYVLAAAIERNGLAPMFEQVSREKVYVGQSAGSMIWSRHLADGVAVFGDAGEAAVTGSAPTAPLPLLDVYLKPHLAPSVMPERTEAWARERAASAAYPIWFVDDSSAVLVTGADASVVTTVGEGRVLKLNDLNP
ncbi:Type 1 glutamine amidotransferase-like domain-containing protein [Nocardioides sp. CCNWLW239]|uniref:Type 1 glutamine amidotransferase-like domain-containing protein n=1 Tax=Nocardioides sp. CCNWLW239 TaxID=3128902 RepID=UPI00301A4C0F